MDIPVSSRPKKYSSFRGVNFMVTYVISLAFIRTVNAVYTQIWIAICDYLLLIIAKKRYGLDPSLHSISNSIGQVLFQRADIREIYNQPTTPVCVPEAGSVEQPTLW